VHCLSTGVLKTKVVQVVAVVVSLIAVLIMAAMTVAASISTQLRDGAITAAGFMELFFLIWIIKQI